MQREWILSSSNSNTFMTLKTILNPAIILLTTALISGCASMEQARTFGTLQNDVVSGDFVKASEIAVKQSRVDEDTGQPTELLWSLQSGALYRMKQRYEDSNLFFDASEELMFQEDTRGTTSSLLGEAGTFFINDTILPYQQSHYDGIMANTYKALNFAAMRDINNARIEWNRVDDRQRRAVENFSRQIAKRQEDIQQEQQEQAEASASAFSGMSPDIQGSFEQSLRMLANNGANDMSVWQPYEDYVNPFTTYMHGLYFMLNAQSRSDYSRAYESLSRAYSLTGSEMVKGDMAIAQQLMKGLPADKIPPRVWVVFENGLSAHKEEFRIDLPIIFSNQNVIYTGVALPKLVERGIAYTHVSANGVSSEVVGDMDRIIKAEFKEEYNYILMKELVRAAAKTVAQNQLGNANPYLGMGMGMLQAATTAADIRMWSTLPKEFQVARVKRPENGIVALTAPETNRVMNVEITSESRFNIIYVKAVSQYHEPIVEVISI